MRFQFTLEAIVHSFHSLITYLGEDWFQEKVTQIDHQRATQKVAGNLPHADHPLIHGYLLFPSWKSECEQKGFVWFPEEIVNIALLGQSLEMIKNDKKFHKLLARLKQPDDFYSTAFEIEVAASHIEQGLKVEFVDEKEIPTPDLRVSNGSNDCFWIECKNRDLSNEKQTEDVWAQIQGILLRYLEINHLNYQLIIFANQQLTIKDVSLVKNFVIQTIEHQFEPRSLIRLPMASITTNDTTNKFKLIIYKLSEPDEELNSDIFKLPYPEVKADSGIFICKRSDLANGKSIIINPQAIQFHYTNSLRVQRVENAFKKAVRQLPESGPGVIHIRLPINSWVTDLSETQMQVEKYLRKELKGNLNRRVNAVVVSIYYSELTENGLFKSVVYKPYTLVVEHTNPYRGVRF